MLKLFGLENADGADASPQPDANNNANPAASGSESSNAKPESNEPETVLSDELWVWTSLTYGRLSVQGDDVEASEEAPKKEEEPVPRRSACGSLMVRVVGDAVLYVPEEAVKHELEVEVFTYASDKEGFVETVSVRELTASFKAKVAKRMGIKDGRVRLVASGHEVLDDALPLACIGLPLQAPHRVLAIVEEFSRFSFDPSWCHGNLVLSNNNTTARIEPSLGETDSTVRGTVLIREGRVFWDVMVVRTAQSRINIGVATDQVSQSSYIGNDVNGWSYYGKTGKAEHAADNKAYGEQYGAGDIVRVKLNMDAREISFARNGNDMGVAHSNLPDAVYPAFTLHHPGDELSLVHFGTW